MLKDLGHLRDIDPVYHDAGPFGGVTLEALHQDVSRFELPLFAPEGVRRNYDATRHAYIFSYFSYDLVTLATNQLLPCLELALRERMQPQSGAGPRGKARGPNLQKLLVAPQSTGSFRVDTIACMNCGTCCNTETTRFSTRTCS